MSNDSTFLSNIKKIDDAIPSESAAEPLKAPDLGEICKIVAKIKGPLNAILPVIELLPVYGSVVAKSLRLLLQVSDVACQT